MRTLGELAKEVDQIIKDSEKILVTTHRKPDVDALASLVLFNHILEKFYGKDAEQIVEEHDGRIAAFKSLGISNLEKVEIVEFNTEVDLSKYDLVVLLDQGRVSRALNNSVNFPINMVIIDHHEILENNEALIVNEKLSSTVEQIFYLFEELYKDQLYTEEISALVQLGIYDDTGSFNYLTTPRTFSLISKLREIVEIPYDKVDYVLNPLSKRSLQVLKLIVENVKYKSDFAYTYIDPKSIEESDFTKEEIKEAADYFLRKVLLRIDSVRWGFIVKANNDEVKDQYTISFRSVEGSYNVKELAEKFDGGGHLWSAGGIVYAENLKVALDKILEEV